MPFYSGACPWIDEFRFIGDQEMEVIAHPVHKIPPEHDFHVPRVFFSLTVKMKDSKWFRS